MNGIKKIVFILLIMSVGTVYAACGDESACNICNPIATPLYTSWDTTPNNLYFRLNAGASFMPSIESRNRPQTGSGAEINSTYSMGTGYMGDLAMGYRVHNVRGEIAAQYVYNTIRGFYNPSLNDLTSGDINVMGAMFNIYYDFNNPTWIYPYLGVGVGAFSLKDSRGSQATPAGFSGSTTVWGGQGIFGLGFRINDTWSFLVDYRRFYSASSSIDMNTNPSSSSRTEQYGYTTNLVTMGFMAEMG